MTPLRIVLVMLQPPVPFGGAAARWLYVLLRGLVARGHRVTALAACRPEDCGAAAGVFDGQVDLRLFPYRTEGSWRTKLDSVRRPASYLFSDALKESLTRELTGGFDLLHLEELWAGWLGLGVADRAVLNVHNLYAVDLAEQRASRPVTSLLTTLAERRILRHYPTVTTVTPRLGQCIREINPGAHVTTTPLGLALDQYPFRPPTPRAPPTVGLIGSFSWAPTLSAAVRLLDRLWPEIQRRVPGARLRLVGRQAKAVLGPRALGPNITVDEDVPDIVPYFRSLDVLLYAPTHATGMKVKVLEAMAFGVPVVSNAEGIEGVPAQDDVHAGLSESDDGLVDRAVALLTGVAKRARQAAAARSLVERYCSGEVALDATEAHYRVMLSARSGRTGVPSAVP